MCPRLSMLKTIGLTQYTPEIDAALAKVLRPGYHLTVRVVDSVEDVALVRIVGEPTLVSWVRNKLNSFF
jgi:hypothetical protein